MPTMTLLFTDVVDSTLLVQRLGDAAAAQLWAQHDEFAHALLAAHGGREIDRSDGYFLLFDEPAPALAFATAYHAALGSLGLRSRVGVHCGEVSLRRTPADAVARGAKPLEVEGLAKPLAARVMAVAGGGQTLLTEAVRAALANPPAGTELRSHGHWRLKGIDDPVALFELGAEGSAFVPPQDGEKAYRVLRGDGLWLPAREIRHNLAPERDAFVGRATELRDLARRLEAGCRLINVLGVGGTGKTRLVRRYGRAWLGEWPGGVYFCDLSEARSLDGICFSVAGALGVPLGRDNPVEQLGHAIAGRGRCLLILDNFEQVVMHAEATLGRWLDRAAEAAFVATSRERMHLNGEEVCALEPLPPETEGVELFELRARAQQPALVQDEAHSAAVARIVRLLDGLPLAIELAAARMRVLSAAQIEQRLANRFQLLAGARGAAARQATLRAAIDWSWELLTPWEQAALAQCAVFDGGFTIEAAEQVLDLAAHADAPPMLDVVQSLVDKSLLRVWLPIEQRRLDIAEPYFGMYLTIHEYAGDRLRRASAQQAAAEARHGRYFARAGLDEAILALARHGGMRRRHELRLEIDNLVSACTRAAERGDAATAVATLRAAWMVLDLTGPLGPAARLAPQVLAIEVMPTALRAQALIVLAGVDWRAGRVDQATGGFEAALDLLEPLIDAPAEARRRGRTLNELGLLMHERGMGERARGCWERALIVAREYGDRALEGSVVGNAALQDWREGRTDVARRQWQAAAAIAAEAGNLVSEGVAVGNLAMLSDEQGRHDEALELYERALALHRLVGNLRFAAIVHANRGCLHADRRDWAEAKASFESALAIAREVGDRRSEGVVLGNLGRLTFDQQQSTDALPMLQAALAIHREVANRNEEGSVLGALGNLLLDLGRLQDARSMLAAGEEMLRGIGSRLGLANMLCVRGRLDVAQGDIAAAHSALAEAQEAWVALGSAEGSALAVAIEELRRVLPG